MWSNTCPKPGTKALKDKDEECCVDAIQALGKIGPEAKEAVSALKSLRLNTSSDIRDAAVAALKKIQEHPVKSQTGYRSALRPKATSNALTAGTSMASVVNP